jgi:hypothetical protein
LEGTRPLKRLRAESGRLWGASSDAYHRIDKLLSELVTPNLHDIPRNLPFRVEMWDRADQHVRWVIAASASVAIGHAALDSAIANPNQPAKSQAVWRRSLSLSQLDIRTDLHGVSADHEIYASTSMSHASPSARQSNRILPFN